MEKKKWSITLNAPVTLTYGAVCLAVLVIGGITGGWFIEKFFMTFRSPLTSPLTWLRFFTHICGHAGWSHLIGNMSYVLLLGPLLEEKYGSGSIIRVMAITALSTGVLNYILFPTSALLGASGVVFAFILMSSFTNYKNGEIPLTFVLVAVIYLGQQIYDGIFVQDNVANFAHIIGGVVGAIAGFTLRKKG